MPVLWVTKMVCANVKGSKGGICLCYGMTIVHGYDRVVLLLN